MSQEITPIIIIGSARNGTTNLENLVAAFPQVAGVEHWLHHGSQESNIYGNHWYWGDFTRPAQYIRFLYQYASSDYFQQCNGDINYHLKHPQPNFYSFFLELMDQYTTMEGKKYWTTKLDPRFFYDDKQRGSFLALLRARYSTVKFIRIQRNFKDAFNSYRNMEGPKYKLRQKTFALLPALIYQACRYTLIYRNNGTYVGDNHLHIPFERYIQNRKVYVEKIAAFIGITIEDIATINLNRFSQNTSFSSKKRRALPPTIDRRIPLVLKLLYTFPFLAKITWKNYYWAKGPTLPLFHRLLKYQYFREELVEELTGQHALDLVEQIKERSET